MLTDLDRLRYRLYEESVQTPDTHAEWFQGIYRDLTGKRAKVLCEDFCGTFATSAEWVILAKDHVAYGLDLDDKPLLYGLEARSKKLGGDQFKRLRPLKMDVTSSKRPRSDMVVACNFSFNIFKKEAELLRYFKAVYRSLKKNGVFLLEIGGGPGMVEEVRERKKYKGFWYTWHQRSFNPVNSDAQYSIHFHRPGKKPAKIMDAFTYDWRMWTIPELRYWMEQAGFPRTQVYWEERDHNGKGSGVYTQRNDGDNDWAWISYLAGVK